MTRRKGSLLSLLAASAFAVAGALGLLSVIACTPPNNPYNTEDHPSRVAGQIVPNETTYEVRGVFKSFDPDNERATIAIEEIPGYMRAATMTYKVHSSSDFYNLNADDKVSFHIRVTPDNDALIIDLKKIDSGK